MRRRSSVFPILLCASSLLTLVLAAGCESDDDSVPSPPDGAGGSASLDSGPDAAKDGGPDTHERAGPDAQEDAGEARTFDAGEPRDGLKDAAPTNDGGSPEAGQLPPGRPASWFVFEASRGPLPWGAGVRTATRQITETICARGRLAPPLLLGEKVTGSYRIDSTGFAGGLVSDTPRTVFDAWDSATSAYLMTARAAGPARVSQVNFSRQGAAFLLDDVVRGDTTDCANNFLLGGEPFVALDITAAMQFPTDASLKRVDEASPSPRPSNLIFSGEDAVMEDLLRREEATLTFWVHVAGLTKAEVDAVFASEACSTAHLAGCRAIYRRLIDLFSPLALPKTLEDLKGPPRWSMNPVPFLSF